MLVALLVLLPLHFRLIYSNYYIDEACCQMFLEEPNCLDKCLEIIADENITQFSPKLFQCAPDRQTQQKIGRCISRSNHGLPVDRGVCCEKALSAQCGDACAVASPINDFNGKCDRSRETEVYSCVEEYLHLKECCYGSPVNMTCAAACNSALQYGPTLQDWVKVRLECDAVFPQVKECMTRYSGDSNTSKYECCNQSDKEQCRYICNKGMAGDVSQTELLSGLFDACGDPIQDATWHCLMSEKSAAISPLGELTAIQCCRKAYTDHCRNLCLGLYKNWLSTDLWDDFSLKCRYQPREEEMTNCILDVSEPCTLGCDHLTFCENLNNRPLDLFRTCSSKYDEGAEKDYRMWVERGWIETPLVNITVKNITTCKPDVWKGIACVLQTKPCHEKSHSNSICNSVCTDLLESCLDKSRSRRSVVEICAILAPNSEPDHCIDLDQYLGPGIPDDHGIVTHPCQPSPCASTQQCVLNRSCVNGDMHCVPYICQESCSIGALRDYQIEVGSWVRLPVVEDSDCFKVCTCDTNKKLSSCQELQCPGSTDCKIGSTYYSHMSQFNYDCNLCVCYSGIVTCTKSTCQDVNSVEKSSGLTLPGSCSPYYSPVCGSNGATYPNPCIARQFNMKESQLHYQSCNTVDVCINAVCQDNQVCRPAPRTCLDLRLPCPQYVCESPTINCEGEDLEPVCDTNNVQHPHMCSLTQQQRKLAHKGYCVGSCNSTTGPVCGANGRNYPSACAAETDYMIIDYYGECKPPSDAQFAQNRYCSDDIVCPTIPSTCIGNVVPGMCCPVCGAVVSLLPSQVLVTINEMYIVNNKLTVSLLCRKLNSLLSLSECVVQCNLGLYGDIIALVYSTLPVPTWVQIEACNNEAVRLETMIRLKNVRIQTDLVLSTILGAQTSPANLTYRTRNSSPTLSYDIFIIFIAILFIRACQFERVF